ncbi:MAG: DUF485 domain-containing protein [Solirubrobacteraceae bacterium]
MENRVYNPRGESAGSVIRWHEIAQSPEFARLEALRRRITLALLGVFTVCFGSFLICCGYARPFMSKSVDGGLTVAYTWLLALTVLAWVLVYVYLRLSDGRLGRMAQDIVERNRSHEDLDAEDDS